MVSVGRGCNALMFVLAACWVRLAAAYMDGYGESPGTVRWLKTSDLLQPLRSGRDRDNADNFTRTFAFDEREGQLLLAQRWGGPAWWPDLQLPSLVMGGPAGWSRGNWFSCHPQPAFH